MNTSIPLGHFKTFCPHCDISVEIPEELRNQDVVCPECQREFRAMVRNPRFKTAMPVTTKSRTAWLLPGVITIAGTVVVWIFWKIISSKASIQFVMENSESIGTVGIYLLGLLLAIMWVLFPVIVYRGIREMIKLLSQIEMNTRQK